MGQATLAQRGHIKQQEAGGIGNELDAEIETSKETLGRLRVNLALHFSEKAVGEQKRRGTRDNLHMEPSLPFHQADRDCDALRASENLVISKLEEDRAWTFTEEID